jgi:hypothetical protein
MSGNDPFSATNTRNILQHVLSPKIVGSAQGPFQVEVDIINVDTAYVTNVGSSAAHTSNVLTNQVGGEGSDSVKQVFATQIGTKTTPVVQEYINSLGSPDYPVNQAFVTNLGTADSHVTRHYVDRIGDSVNRVTDIWVNRLHWTSLDPVPAGGGGGGPGTTGATGPAGLTGPQGATGSAGSQGATGSAGSQGATGTRGPTGSSPIINVGSTQTLPSGSSATVSTGITTPPFVTLNFGIPAGPVGPPGPAGPPGTGGGGSSATGPTGQVAFVTPNGTTSSQNFKFINNIVSAPTLQSTGGNVVQITNDGSNSYLESGSVNVQGSGNFLQVANIDHTKPTVIFDTVNQRVGVNNSNPLSTLDVIGPTTITYNASNGATANIMPIVLGGATGTSSITLVPGVYNFYTWGQGGYANGGSGGAAGFQRGQFNVGSTGTIAWMPIGGATGGNGNVSGGNGLIVSFNGSPFIWTAGGGGGAQGAQGAWFGSQNATPSPEGGNSAGNTGGTGGASPEIINTPQLVTFNTTGTTRSALFTQGITIQSSTVSLNSSLGGTRTGATISFSNPVIIDESSGTYTDIVLLQSGTMTINGSLGITGTFTSGQNNITASGINVSSYGITGTTQPLINTNVALYKNKDNSGYTTADTTIGISGVTVSNGMMNLNAQNLVLTASKLRIPSGNGYVYDPNGNLLTFNPGEVITFSDAVNIPIPVTVTGNITIPIGSSFPVTSVINNIVGNSGSSVYGGPGSVVAGGGGGGGYYGGGGAAYSTQNGIASGGGAGSCYLATSGITGLSAISGSAYGGNGVVPYAGTYNMTGVYGAGGYGNTNPGSSFIALEKVSTSTTPAPALVVNGDELVNGNIRTTNNLNVNGSSYLNQNVIINNNSAPGYSFTVNNPSVLGNTLNVLGSTVCAAGLTVGGGATAGSGLTVSNGATISTSGSGPAVTVRGILSASDVIATSDVRTKENIVTIDSALDKVLKMRGVYFNKKNDQQRRVGVIAQETEEVLPEVVFTDDSDDKNKSVAYGNIVGLLIEAIKEQQVIIDRLM